MARGGSRPGAGRRPGTPNKSTADVKAMALRYTGDAMQELARLAVKAESEAARVAAIKELLERAYGKSAQGVTVSADGDITKILVSWLKPT